MLETARRELQQIEERRYDYTFHRQATQWTQVGDWVIGEFFSDLPERGFAGYTALMDLLRLSLGALGSCHGLL